MIDLNICIDIIEGDDLKVVVDAIKSIGVESPVYILDFANHYHIRYDTNENIEGIETALRGRFSNYSMMESIGVGRTDIKLIVSIRQSPFSTDSWGSRFNSDSIVRTYYFIEENEVVDIVVPNQNLQVLFGSEERKYPIYITPVVSQAEPNKKGFIATATPFKKEGPQDLLSDKLFAAPTDAFWAGYRTLEQTIEKEYLEFVKASRKRPKKKTDGKS